MMTKQWCNNEPNGISNGQPRDCLLNCIFWYRWKKTSKLRVTGFSAGNSPVTGEFPAQRASNLVNVYIWWCDHEHFQTWSSYLTFLVNTLRPSQNNHHFPDNIFTCIFLNENVQIWIKISLKFLTCWLSLLTQLTSCRWCHILLWNTIWDPEIVNQQYENWYINY